MCQQLHARFTLHADSPRGSGDGFLSVPAMTSGVAKQRTAPLAAHLTARTTQRPFPHLVYLFSHQLDRKSLTETQENTVHFQNKTNANFLCVFV